MAVLPTNANTAVISGRTFVPHASDAATPAPSSDGRIVEMPRDMSRVGGQKSFSCEIDAPAVSAAGISGMHKCARELQRRIAQGPAADVAPARDALDRVTQQELGALDQLTAIAGKGNTSVQAEVASLYNQQYALMPPVVPAYQYDADRQKAYSERLDTYVRQAMETKMPVDTSGTTMSLAVRDSALRVLESTPAATASANTRLWLARESNRDLVTTLYTTPAERAWLTALHSDPATRDSSVVRDAWKGLPSWVAQQSDPRATFETVQHELPAGDRAWLRQSVRAQLEHAVALAQEPQNRERWPDAEARARRNLASFDTAK